MSGRLTHFDADGAAQMVDVSAKAVTDRTAIARGEIAMAAQTLAAIRAGTARKGDVLGVARLAGIMAAKRTHELIPLCHPLAIAKVGIALDTAEDPPRVIAEATVKTTGQTGVEMEALTAVSVTLLTVYDMVKAMDKAMVIGPVRLVFKDGGASGLYEAAP